MWRDVVIGLMVVAGLSAVWGIGYGMGCEAMLRRVKSYFAIYHGAQPYEGQNLIRFLEK